MKYLSMLIKGDAFLRRLACISLIFLLIVQFFYLKDVTRRHFSYIDRLEGESITNHMPLYPIKPLAITETSETPVLHSIKSLRESKVIVIRMIQPRQSETVFVTINGQISSDFKTGDAKVTVYSGDYLEIDASAMSEFSRYVVSIPSSGIVFPEDGTVIEAKSSIIPVGKVKFK